MTRARATRLAEYSEAGACACETDAVAVGNLDVSATLDMTLLDYVISTKGRKPRVEKSSGSGWLNNGAIVMRAPATRLAEYRSEQGREPSARRT